MILRCVLVLSIVTLVRSKNEFEATDGCEQYDSSQGYNYPHPYYPISSFRNANVSKEGIVNIRLGMYANSDGYVRLAPKQFPYQDTVMHEIVFTGSNQQTFVRRYRRIDESNVVDVDNLIAIRSESLTSPFKPLMFTMAIHPFGLVQLTKDYEVLPFLQFSDTQNSFNYISFSNGETPAVFFFDCPLDYDDDDDDDDDDEDDSEEESEQIARF